MDKWIGPYPVGELIGWGGFASVYRTHARYGTPLVLKVADQGGQGPRTFAEEVRPAQAVWYHTGSTIIGGRLDPGEVQELFRVEALTLRAAAGHRLPRLIDERRAEDGSPVLVMEELMAPWSLELAPFEDFARILDACAELQGPGHGDLKPEHVFLDANSEFVFIDPEYRSHEDSGDRYFLFGTVTPEYNPNPSMGRAARDVCSTAVMIYQRLTGDFPGGPPNWHARALSHLSAMADAGTLPSGNVGLTPALPAVVGWAKLVFGWMLAYRSPGEGLGSFDIKSWPRWLNDHRAAAAQLRAAIADQTPELA